jgi:hypothetical protein
MTDVQKLSRQDYLFLLYLFVLISAYAIHFLSFTLFEGFSTFSNDAGSYVVLARKWSPYFPPGDAVLYTWPIQILPPGFPWALAITGASKSLWSSHLFVSLCMLASIFLVGWKVYRRTGRLVGSLLTLGLCLLPGVVTSSMGILSENLYLLLSLVVLLLYSFIKNTEAKVLAWYLLLLLFLTFVILTRTIGIALITAIVLKTLLDKDIHGKQKIGFLLIAFSSVALWQLWGFINTQSSDLTYSYYLKQYVGTEVTVFSGLAYLWHTMSTNLIQILSSWSHYFSLSYSNIWFFLSSFSLLIFCLIGLGFRLLQRKLDAIYLMFYFAILLIWPNPDQFTRFLHPVVFLLLLQPILYFAGNSHIRHPLLVKTVLVSVALILITNSIIVQARLLEQRGTVMDLDPELTHSYEFYDSPSREFGLMRALHFTDIMKYMAASAQHVPIHGVVATVKPVNYAILADRRAVNLVALVPQMQQLCNLKIKDVDVVFLSALTTKFNREGRTNLEKYRGVSSDVWTATSNGGEGMAYSVVIDKMKLDSELLKEGYNCQSYQDF